MKKKSCIKINQRCNKMPSELLITELIFIFSKGVVTGGQCKNGYNVGFDQSGFIENETQLHFNQSQRFKFFISHRSRCDIAKYQFVQ